MNSSLVAKWLMRAYKSDDPQRVLFILMQSVAVDHEMVKHLVQHVVNISPNLREDLATFYSRDDYEPYTNMVHYIYFLTQHVHLFGKIKGDQFILFGQVQICTFRFNNCPCPYIWINLIGNVPKLMRQTLPDYEVEKPLKITLETPNGVKRYSLNLETCACEETNRTGVITLICGNGLFNCSMGREAVVEDRITPIVLILTVDHVFTESVLIQANGKKSIIPTWQHMNVS